jgi:tRNA threonylcarbamoyladenosine biosynthesis protein TsaB
MNLLAIDTSTDACSAALSLANGRLVDRFELAPRRQSERILPMVEEVLNEAGLRLRDLDGLAFGRGPGAFTGLRIAAGVIQGMAYGADLRVAPISTLAALAQQGFEHSHHPHVLAALDARMGQIYFGTFRVDEAGLVRAVGEECVVDPSKAVLPQDGEWLGVGSGFDAYEALLCGQTNGRTVTHLPSLHPRAREVARLASRVFAAGEALPAALALPVYIRDHVAEVSGRAVR